MGNSSSKAARAAGSAARQYPSRASKQSIPSVNSSPSTTTTVSPIPGSPESVPGPTVHPSTRASGTRNEAIDLDARDPDFASRLSELGPVNPFPTYSPSSTVASNDSVSSPTSTTSNPSTGNAPSIKNRVFPTAAANPAVAILTARSRLQEAADAEKVAVGKAGFQGKEFLDIATVRKVLALRDEQGMKQEEIERALGLKKGVVQRLGRVGVVEAA